jgi:hypothetical protein
LLIAWIWYAQQLCCFIFSVSDFQISISMSVWYLMVKQNAPNSCTCMIEIRNVFQRRKHQNYEPN